MKNLFKLLAFVFVCATAFSACHENGKENERIDNATDAQLDTTTQVVVGYCSTDLTNYFPVGQDQTEGKIYEQSAAIHLTSDVLAGYDANRIIKVAVALSKDTKNYSKLRFWVRESLDGENIWEYSYTGKVELGVWMEVLVSPYFKIQKDKEYYLGYTIDADLLPIAGDKNPSPNPEATYIYDCATEEWIQYSDMGNLRLYAVVSGDWMPKADLQLNAISAPSFVKPNSAYCVGVTVENKAVKEGISSFDLLVSADGKELARKNVSLSKPLSVNRKASVVIKDIVLTNGGVMDIDYSIVNVNDKSDSNKDAKSIKVRTDVSDAFVARKVLLENFTAAGCVNCPAGHDAIADVISKLGEEKFVWACHHSGYNPDQFTLKQGDSCAQAFYNSPNSGAPAMMLDRVNLSACGATLQGPATGPVFFPNNHSQNGELYSFMELASTNVSPVVLEEEHSFDAGSRKLTVNVSGSVLSDLVNPDGFGIGIMILEDSIYGKQNGVSGAYYFMDVVRGCSTSVFSKSVKVKDGKFSLSSSIIIDEQKKPENMQVVVWAQNRPVPFHPVKNANDCNVYQTTISDLQ